MKIAFLCLTACLLVTSAAAADEHKSTVAASPAFEHMKSLQGGWAGTALDSGKEYPADTRFALISDGSALMAWLGEGTPYEMVTIFHMDGADLMATHYCSAHNQPRMVAVAGSDPNRLIFKFKDGTNIAPGHGHMQEVAFIFDGADHHIEEWTYLDGDGKLSTAKFDFKRKK